MQTLYYTTDHFVRRTGNVVDLCEYRRRLEQAQARSSTSCTQQADEGMKTEAAQPRPRRSAIRHRQGLILDVCASVGILVMTLTFTLHVLCL